MRQHLDAMNEQTILLISLGTLGFGLISGRLRGTLVTLPMVFTVFGLFLGRLGFDLIGLSTTGEIVRGIAELTLILVLFTDASRIDLQILFREHRIPIRLLGIGLPGTILMGLVVGVFLLSGQLTIWEIAVLAAILAPTDAALGQSVVSDPKVPIRIRQALNVESGLNDGICLPILLILISIAAGVDSDEATGRTTTEWALFVILQISLGPIAGIIVGWVGGALLKKSTRLGWIDEAFERISSLAVAVLAYSGAEVIGGNGFIAAFCAGLTMGNFTRSVCRCLYQFAEAEGQLFTLLIFLIFGAVMAPTAFTMPWEGWCYAVLSLTLIRGVPVVLSLVGLKLRQVSLGFLAWFGPRGIASILYTILVLEESRISHRQEIQAIVAGTVLLSIVAHGLSAAPATGLYGRRIKKSDLPESAEEKREVTPMPTRHSPRLTH